MDPIDQGAVYGVDGLRVLCNASRTSIFPSIASVVFTDSYGTFFFKLCHLSLFLDSLFELKLARKTDQIKYMPVIVARVTA